MSDSGSVAADRRVSGVAMLPWRRIILIVLGATISFVVAVGVYKTLTLPEGERYSGDFWIDQIVNGIGQGAILALIALGYTLVYGILRMINFAHGEVFMAGAFISFFFADAYLRSGFLNAQPYMALFILLVVSVAASTLVAVLLERIAYRPLRNAPRLVPLITAIGASLFIANSFRGFFGPQPYGYPRPTVLDGSVDIIGIPVARVQLLVFVAAIVAMVALQLFVHRSKTGRSMRAVAEDSEIASLMGINVDRIVVITFIVGGVLGGGRRPALFARVHAGAVHDGVPAGHRGLHGRRARRHRQHRRRGARRVPARRAAGGRAVAVPHGVRHPERELAA